MKKLFKGIGLIAISAIIGFLCLVIVFFLPTDPMKKHVAENIDRFTQEGINPVLIEGFESTRIDNYSDGLILNSAIYDGEESVISKAAGNYQILYDGENYYHSLISYIGGRPDYIRGSYARYWHGYLVLLKPLLLFFNYAEIRMFNMLLQLGLIVFVIWKMMKKGIGEYIPCFCVTMMFLTSSVLFLSLEYSALFYVTIIAIIILLSFDNYLIHRQHIPEYFLLIGIMVAYIDVLTYPLVTWGLPLVFYLLMKAHNDSYFVNKIKEIVIPSFYWLIGYIGMWGSKWVLATLFTEENVLKDAILMVLYRMSNESAESGEILKISFLEPLRRNFSVYNHSVYYFLLFILSGYIIYRFTKHNSKYQFNLLTFFQFLFISIIPVVWYLIIGNHSYIHYWMTHRNIVVIVFSLSCYLIKGMECKRI